MSTTITPICTPRAPQCWPTKTPRRAWQSHTTVHFPASPADALPQQTFSASQKLQANGEIVMLQYFQPAHTDTDVYIHFQKANVIHMGDTFFNGFYPVIDASTGGKIDGMIVAADKVLPLADNNTKIVPGHGPLGNKADLTKFRDML